MADVANNAMQATLAYRSAVEDYGNFIDAAMRQYGWTMPDASGQYSVQGAQDAFDPDRVIQFDTAGKPIFDVAGVAARTAGGQYGTTGLFARTAQESAAQEAEVRAAARGRGLRGGLASQQERLAETLAGQQMGAVSAGLFGDITQRYGGLGKSYQQVAVGEATDAAINAANAASNLALSNAITSAIASAMPPPSVASTPSAEAAAPAASPAPAPTSAAGYRSGDVVPSNNRGNFTVKGNPGGNEPKNAQPGQVFVGKQGVTWVYRSAGPNGAGWYKKG